jgi:hypothetical protein
LVRVEKDIRTIIMEKDEAKSKLIRLEEENRNLAMLLNESRNEEQQDTLSKVKETYENYRKQSVELAKAVDDAKNKEKEVNDLNENLRQSDRKNKILMELIEYQKGPVDDVVDELLS